MKIVGRIAGWTIWLTILLAIVVLAGWGARAIRERNDEPAEPSICFVEERGVVCP